MRLAILTFAVLGSASAATPIEGWSRPAGATADKYFERKDVLTLDLESLPVVDEVRVDFQTGAKKKFRGVPLATVLGKAPGHETDDLALLHFKNGMQVPVALADIAGLDAFVALGKFAPLKKKGAEKIDRRPSVFQGNKIVVATGAAPGVDLPPAFSPWSHVDSLTGIEWVNARAWWAHYEVPEANEQVKTGLQVFRRACHFCHGVRDVGSSFGWDFVKPISISTYRPKDSLYLHVRYRELDAPERGLMMPAFKEFTQAEADALHAWLKAINAAAPAVYSP